jgi:RNA polymerase sigma factor (sigma-70 family)
MTTKTDKHRKRSPKPQSSPTPFASNLYLTSEQLRLFDEHERIVNMAAAKYGRGRYRENRDDIAQEARAALVKAIQSYDASRGVLFEAYARKCIHNHCLDFLKKRTQPKSHDDLMRDKETGKTITLFEKVETLLARREIQDHSDGNYYQRVSQVRYAIANNLQGIERRAAMLRLRGLTTTKIAKRLKIPKTTAHRALNDAVTKLRKRLTK